MAVQGCRSGWKSHGAGRILKGDENVFAARNFVNGAYEGLCAAVWYPNLARLTSY